MKRRSVLPGQVHSKERSRAALSRALLSAFKKGGCPSAIMFSGGFDSVFLYEHARLVSPGVTAVTVAFDRYNRRTVLEARRAARLLGARHTVVGVSLAEYLASARRIRILLKGNCDDADLPLVHAALRKLPLPLKSFWAGMGSDQWLGEEAATGGTALRLQRRQARVMVCQHRSVAKDARRTIFFPFLEAAVLGAAVRIPAPLKKGKQLLRSLSPETSVLFPGKASAELQVPLPVRSLALRCFGSKEATRS